MGTRLIDLLPESERLAQKLKAVTGKSGISLADQDNAVVRAGFPQGQPDTRQTLLQETEVKSGVVRNELGTAGKLKELVSGIRERRSVGDHVVVNAVNPRHLIRNRHGGVDQSFEAGLHSVPVDPHRPDLNDPVADGAHSGSLDVKYRKRPHDMPCGCHSYLSP